MIDKANFAGVIEKAQKSVAQLQQKARSPLFAPRVGGLLEEVVKSLRELSDSGKELLADNQALETTVHAANDELQRYRALFDDAPDPYIVAAVDGSLQEANRAAQKVFGIEPRQNASRSLFEFVHKRDRNAFEECLRHALAGEHASLCNGTMTTAAGRAIHMQVTMAPVRPPGAAAAVCMMFRDLSDRDEAQHELQARESRYHTLVETAPTVIIAIHSNWKIVQWNAEAERVFGLSPHEALGANFLTRCVPEEARASVETKLRATFEGHTTRFESHIRTKENEVRIMLWCAAPLPTLDHELPELTICGQDMTEHREAEHQRLLVSEIQHRVKNNLASVLAIADQTFAKSSSLEEFKHAFRGRVFALSQMHTLLSQRNLQGLPMRMLIMQSLSPYVAPGGPHVELQADPVLLTAKAGQCFSIALHELATNAAKYGALTTSRGHVDVRVQLHPQRDQLTLTWEESGGPPVTPPAKLGLGSDLINQVIRYELQGYAKLSFEPTGLRCEITVPWTPMVGMIDHEANAAKDSSGQAAVPVDLLAGRRVLLVEDNALVAQELHRMLDEMRCIVVGPAATLEHAFDLVHGERLDVVLLDVDLGGYEVWPLADELLDLDIPFVLTTGLSCPQSLPPEFRELPYLEKPFDQRQLAEKLADVLSGIGSHRQ